MDFVKNPFIAITPPFIAGIIFSVIFPFNAGLLFPFLPAFLIIFFIIEKKIFAKNPHLFGLTIYIFLFIFGSYITYIKKPHQPEINSSEKFVYEGVIVEPPKEKTKTINCVVEVEAFLDSAKWVELHTKSVVYFQKDSVSKNFEYGDRILFNTYLNKISNPGNPKEFDYESFMNNKGIFTTGYAKSGDFMVLQNKQARLDIYLATKMRNNLLKIYRDFGFQDREYAVLSALTLGYRDEVDLETREMFANTGAMHILAVSGLHVGIIFLILNVLLKFMDKKPKLKIVKSIIIIISLWIFAAIAGLSPSVCRSALMFSLIVFGKMINKNSSTFNTIFASAFILLLINPLDVLSVGFRLSYAAVMAIVYFQPYIYKLLFFQKWLPDKIWALTSVSIAAQLGTMPIGLLYFHQFPNYFFLTNILVIPLASIILYLAVALMITSFIPLIADFVAFLLKVSMKVLIGGVSLIDKIPFAVTKDISISGIQTLLLYVIIFAFVLFWIYNRKQLLYAFLISCILFISANIIKKYNIEKKTELIIFNTGNYPVINILVGKDNFVLTDTTTMNKKNPFNYSAKPYWVAQKSKAPLLFDFDSLRLAQFQNEIFATNNNFFKVGNTTFLFLTTGNQINFAVEQKKHVDYIILSQNIYTDIEPITQIFDFKAIIFDGTNKTWRTEKWTEQCKSLDVNYHDITTQGAFAVNFVTTEMIKL